MSEEESVSLGVAKSLEVWGCDGFGLQAALRGTAWGRGDGSPGQPESGESGKLPNKLKSFL